MNSPTTQYYVAKDGQTLGPYTEETICQCLKEGRLAQGDYVLHPEKLEWVSIEAATFLNVIPETPLPALPPLPANPPLVVVRTPQRQTASRASAPAPVSHDLGASGACPLCNGEITRSKILYGKPVCKKCVNSFVGKRQFAWFLDSAVIYFLWLGIAASTSLSDAYPLVTQIVGWIFIFTFFSLKDSISGKSPGKLLFGIRVIDSRTGAHAGVKQSCLRNCILTIPFISIVTDLIGVVQMYKGPRIGDSWAHTKVIWDKYADKSPFAFSDKAAGR